MKRFLSMSLAGCLAALVVACGGGSTNVAVAPPANVIIDNSGLRGALIQNPPQRVHSLDAAAVTAHLNQFGPLLLATAGTPKCGIDFHHFEYSTVGAAGEPAKASGALMVPTGVDPACSGKRPVLLYGHGSAFQRKLNMADISDSSNEGAGRAASAVALFAAQGYIVVAPNYAGYDTSTLNYHPHHIADQQAKDMIDAVTAARKALPNLSSPVADNGKLFITGYSEGGYVAMATHRAMQAAGMTVTASVPQSGSYAESVAYEGFGMPGAFDDLSAYSLTTRLQLAMQITVWQKAYGNIYAAPSEVFPASYANGIETLLPSDSDPSTFVAAGKFPPYLLANDMPNYPGLSTSKKALYGLPEQSLLKTAYVTRMLTDIAASPCPVTAAKAPLDCTPGSAIRAAWLRNDLRTWTPSAPMLMCGGNADLEVGFYNAQLTQAYFLAHGASVPVLDVDAPVTANDPYSLPKNVFNAVKQNVIKAGLDPASADMYHGAMVFAACGVAARDFFGRF